MNTVKTIIFLPTLNEKENLSFLLPKFEKLPINSFLLLVVDDQSRDGTEDFLNNYKSAKFSIKTVVRSEPFGRGHAGREGIRLAAGMHPDVFVEMDADGSHDPSDIPNLMQPVLRNEADVVLGSRGHYRGQTNHEWNYLRRAITVMSNAFARLVLGVGVWDCNSGYRVYSPKALDFLAESSLKASGSNTVHEILYKVHRQGLRLLERPIQFHARHSGATTKTLFDFTRTASTCLFLRLGLWDRLALSSPAPSLHSASKKTESRVS